MVSNMLSLAPPLAHSLCVGGGGGRGGRGGLGVPGEKGSQKSFWRSLGVSGKSGHQRAPQSQATPIGSRLVIPLDSKRAS